MNSPSRPVGGGERGREVVKVEEGETGEVEEKEGVEVGEEEGLGRRKRKGV